MIGRLPALTALAALGCLLPALTDAQFRPATDAEIEFIRDAYTLADIPGWSHLSVLETRASYTEAAGDRPARLDGWIYFRPHLVQGTLCLMQASFVTGIGSQGTYAWGLERFAYWHWDAGAAGDCEIAGAAGVPGRAVQSTAPIPSAAVATILASSDQLLALAYSHAAASPDAEMARALLAYSENAAFRLADLGITQDVSPEYGFAYTATYRAPAGREGPFVVFSLTPDGLVVHTVGRWIA